MSLIKEISEQIEIIFEDYGLPRDLGVVQYSDRPDLSDFQCNGALKAAKELKRNPREIAEDIKEKCDGLGLFSSVTVDGPGFLNFKISDKSLLQKVAQTGNQPSASSLPPKKVIIDYGGPNVAKPLHVGHLRSAIIGESLKRIAKYKGHTVIGDIHLGDWGTPMGMLIAELEARYPDWPYFKKPFRRSKITSEPPFSVETLNALYPEAARHYKESEEFAEKARLATAELQKGRAGYRALWKHFLALSTESIKSDFSVLDVSFDLWLGESDADPYIKGMVKDLLDRGIARIDNGAVVIDVAREDDKRDIPPLMLRKSDGAATYATTDLATIFQRVKDFDPDLILYVVDQRQEQHFVQVFRAAAKAGLIGEDQLEHIGFGTMNGSDGRPFKTREGGVMRLSDLISMAQAKALQASGFENDSIEDDIKDMADAIAIAAIKYGDLQNPRISDYVFDPEAFVAFEGNTGPYNQYQLVRAKAVLGKIDKKGIAKINSTLQLNEQERNLIFTLLQFDEAINRAFDHRMPSEICDYMYRLSRSFSSFYKNCPIANEEDDQKRQLRVMITSQVEQTLEKCMDMLAIPKVDRMLRAEPRRLK